MAKNKTQEVAVAATEESIALLRSQFPVEQGFQRTFLPRLGMVSQDQTEGKGKAMKVTTEAGTFYTEKQGDREDEETGKKLWVKHEIGSEIEGVILYQRRQLSYYDEGSQSYTSSPVYDTDEDIVPLFLDKKEVARGTPAELKKKYEYTDKDGKVKSNLKDNRILYVLYDGQVYQMNLHGSSMYAWMNYSRKVLPPAVLTRFSSEEKENGAIAWNQMTFTAVRNLSEDEVSDIMFRVAEIKQGVEAERAWYASQRPATPEDAEMAKAVADF